MEPPAFQFPDPNAAENRSEESPPKPEPKNSSSNGGVVSPVYWNHDRSASYSSQRSVELNAGITLEDHTEEPTENSSSVWAKAITIDDYVIVRGITTGSGIGAYVVWNCKVEILDGGPMIIRKRYSEFDELRESLIAAFPGAGNALPVLPPKSILYKFQAKFLEKRRAGLAYFLNCVMLNPEFAGSPIVKDFIFARDQ